MKQNIMVMQKVRGGVIIFLIPQDMEIMETRMLVHILA